MIGAQRTAHKLKELAQRYAEAFGEDEHVKYSKPPEEWHYYDDDLKEARKKLYDAIDELCDDDPRED